MGRGTGAILRSRDAASSCHRHVATRVQDRGRGSGSGGRRQARARRAPARRRSRPRASAPSLSPVHRPGRSERARDGPATAARRDHRRHAPLARARGRAPPARGRPRGPALVRSRHGGLDHQAGRPNRGPARAGAPDLPSGLSPGVREQRWAHGAGALHAVRRGEPERRRRPARRRRAAARACVAGRRQGRGQPVLHRGAGALARGAGRRAPRGHWPRPRRRASTAWRCPTRWRT